MVCSPPPTFRGRWSWPRCRSSPARPISYFRLWAFGSSCPLPMGLPPIFESSGLANSSTCSHPCSGFSVCLVASWIGKEIISYPLGLSCSNESVHGRFYTMTFGMTGRNFLPWMPAIIFCGSGYVEGGGNHGRDPSRSWGFQSSMKFWETSHPSFAFRALLAIVFFHGVGFVPSFPLWF